jgi:hypothetical protein
VCSVAACAGESRVERWHFGDVPAISVENLAEVSAEAYRRWRGTLFEEGLRVSLARATRRKLQLKRITSIRGTDVRESA